MFRHTSTITIPLPAGPPLSPYNWRSTPPIRRGLVPAFTCLARGAAKVKLRFEAKQVFATTFSSSRLPAKTSNSAPQQVLVAILRHNDRSKGTLVRSTHPKCGRSECGQRKSRILSSLAALGSKKQEQSDCRRSSRRNQKHVNRLSSFLARPAMWTTEAGHTGAGRL